ncbi:MAG TPA: deoxyribose-phosphate aldolase [bacterium]|nr:deoxyribose-phosphate aldolase [bacterium]
MIDIRSLTLAQVAAVCDHTFLQRPECLRGTATDPLAAYEQAIAAFIEGLLALDPAPYAVCVRAEEVARLRAALSAAGKERIVIAAVVGFPLGDQAPRYLKVLETQFALSQGAREIDTVLRWRALQNGEDEIVRADIAAVVEVAHAQDAPVKIILETCELDDEQIRRACAICTKAGADFVKTSTGFGKGGATVAALTAMRESFAGGIKISGGVNADNLHELLTAAYGAQIEALDPRRMRIGESSLLK